MIKKTFIFQKAFVFNSPNNNIDVIDLNSCPIKGVSPPPAALADVANKYQNNDSLNKDKASSRSADHAQK